MTRTIVKSHYTALELASLGLPRMPGTVQGISLRAKSDRWAFRKRAGRGGGVEYDLDSLPAEAQAELRCRATASLIAVESTPVKSTAIIRREQQLQLMETDTQRLRADARKGILSALDRIMVQCRVSREAAMNALLTQARMGTLDDHLAAMLRAARDERGRKGDDFPSIRTLKRYLGLAKQGSLAPKKPRASFIVPEWAALFLGFYQQPQKPSVESAHRDFEKACVEQRVAYEVPSVHAVRRFLGKLGAVTLQSGRMGSRELKSLLPFIRRTFGGLQPNDVWSADGHTFDAEVQHPLHGRPFRPEITSIVDIATRKGVGFSLDLAESSFAVLDALSAAVLNHGVLATFYVDNGSGYHNALLKDEGVGVAGRLGFEVMHSLPYNSQARGVIERFHQTVWVDAAKKLPSYMGADMDREARNVAHKITRKALKQDGVMPMMGWDDFIQFCHERIDEYNSTPHGSLPFINDPVTGRRRHMSPNEAWDAHVAKGFQADMLDVHDAQLVFRPRETRTVQRAEVRLLNHRYFCDALTEHHGDEVQVAYDIHDARFVSVYTLDGRFICRAEAGANERDYMPASAIEQAREKRADGRVKRLEAKLDEVEAERRGQRALTLDTPEVLEIAGFGQIPRAALDSRVIDMATLVEPSEAVRPIAAAPMATVHEMPERKETPEQTFARWQALDQLISEGGVPETSALKFYAMYPKSSQFASMKRRIEEAGEQQLASR